MPEQKIGRWRASYLLTAESFEFLRNDKEMLWLPFLSLLANVIVLAVVGAIFFGLYVSLPANTFDTRAGEVIEYAGLFVLYIGFAFILTFFQGAIATMVRRRIEGANPTLKDGLGNCARQWGKILRWSLFTATVGIILRLISDKLGWAGRLVGFVGAVAWSALTFFAVPVIVLEDRSIKDSLKRSGQLFREAWGETLVMNFTLGLFLGCLDVFWILAGALLAYYAVISGNIPLLVITGIIFVLGFIVLLVVSSVLGAIFKAVLFEYAASGRVPANFTPQLIIGAIKRTNPAAAHVNAEVPVTPAPTPAPIIP